MKVSEEIEALEVMAINPIQYLVVPRFLAMLVMLPALTIFGNYVGVFGGWAVCTSALDFNTSGYILRALQSADTWDLYSGMIKSVVFAWIVITIACNAGLHVDGGAEASDKPRRLRSCKLCLLCWSRTRCLRESSFLLDELYRSAHHRSCRSCPEIRRSHRAQRYLLQRSSW